MVTKHCEMAIPLLLGWLDVAEKEARWTSAGPLAVSGRPLAALALHSLRIEPH